MIVGMDAIPSHESCFMTGLILRVREEKKKHKTTYRLVIMVSLAFDIFLSTV
jgi:hypothetical protein